MCVISCILKCAISIVNSLLMTIGIVLMVIGALLLWGMNLFLKNIYDLQTMIQNMLSKLGINASASGVISLVQQNSASIGAIAFAVGCVLVAIAILGIIAVCCCSLKKILIVICIFLIAITLGLIVLIIVYGSNPTGMVLSPLVVYLQNNIINKYVSLNATQPESILVNVIQIGVNCCGLYNSSDFNSAANFNRTAIASDNSQYQIAFPVSCCNFNQDFTISQANLDTCIKTNTSTNMNTGCWTKGSPYLTQYLNYCFATIGITIGILVATIIVTIILIKCAAKLE